LRADKFSKLIFEGAPNHPRARVARVSIQFDNSDREIPIDSDTISISRSVVESGESTYRLNGKAVTRSELMDVLGMAGISPSGHNLIMQGAITRLADISPEERRKIIEDLVGISEYNAKKAVAQTQLQQAEINLRIATARMDEVQNRLENLEKERNDALRYNFIQGELRKLRASILSHRILRLKDEIASMTSKFEQIKNEAGQLVEQQKSLLTDREKLEFERRKFDREVVDKGRSRLIALQTAIGDISVKASSLKAEIESLSMSLTGVIRLRDQREKQMESIGEDIEKNSAILSSLKNEHNKIVQMLQDKESKFSEVSSKLNEIKLNLGSNKEKIDQVTEEIEGLRMKMIGLSAKIKEISVRSRVLLNSLQTLQARKLSFEQTLKNLQTNIIGLQEVLKKEKDELDRLSEEFRRRHEQRLRLIKELEEAELIARRGREAIVEFSTQRSLVERVASEEEALKKIEEMGRVKAIPGVYGRLRRLIKIEPKYRAALESASEGWLKAVIVKDLVSALKCVEALKKMKLGRIKLIPLKEVASTSPLVPPDIEGVIGVASSFVKCNERFIPAVNFVFGDTVITSGEKSALLSAKAGYRSVDLKGDLYNPKGGMESGYYRAPIEISSLMLGKTAVSNLENSVKTLEDMLSKRSADIKAIEDEIEKLNEEKVNRIAIVNSLNREITAVKRNIDRVNKNLGVLDSRIKRLQKVIEKDELLRKELDFKRSNMSKFMSELRTELKSLKLQIKPSYLEKLEQTKTQLKDEIDDLQRRLIKIDSDISSINSTLEVTLKPQHKGMQTDLQNLNSQISSLQRRIEEAKSALNESSMQLKQLQLSKEELSKSLLSVDDERSKLESQIDKVDAQLKKVNALYEPMNNELRRVELDLQSKKSDLAHLEEELNNLGYQTPLNVTLEQVKNAEASLTLMRLELEKIGSVNQLAITQYIEQKDNYKFLSIRRNQLEEEKRAILRFMEEIEREKKNVFMNAYTKVNENFKTYFSKLTGGGEGYLSLQNTEDPFAGGLDMFVKFPGKASRLIAGASGGEQSIAAIGFVLSIQSFMPSPFYVLDEIDAHLDPYYAEKLAELLKEMASTSQFILVTFKDVVINKAEKIFGVYLQDGVSNIVSMKLTEEIAK